MSSQAHVLLVEDSAADRALICALLDGFDRVPRVSTATSVAEACDAFGQENFDCALLDFLLPDGDALTILDRLGRAPGAAFPTLVVSGLNDPRLESESLRRGANAFLRKNVLTTDSLESAMSNAILSAVRPRRESAGSMIDTSDLGRWWQLEQVARAIERDVRPASGAASRLAGELRRRFPAAASELEPWIADLREHSARTERQLEDLRRFAQLVPDPSGPERCDPVEAIEVALGEVVEVLREAGVLRLETLPPVSASFSQLAGLFGALIENSLQFRSDEPLQIRVSGSLDGEQVVFQVDDNGQGIASGDMERVFGLFERAATGQNHSGTGLGLALARRIVQLHDGEIWAEPKRRGARIRFSLPAAS